MMKSSFYRRLALLLSTAFLALLQGCAPILIGGAFIGTGMLASDRRTSGTVVEDEGIELKAAARLRENLGDRVHVNITSYNRQVLISGEVPNAQDKQLVEKIVSGVENVRNIVNELGVMGNSTLAQRSSDVVVSSRVKARLVDAQDLSANAFKIVTERGVVYMMGRVTQRESTRATDIVSSTSGVQRVVRLLEIISDAELSRLIPPKTPDSAGTAAPRQ
jgi:osmotically-inducible protein OsmY